MRLTEFEAWLQDDLQALHAHLDDPGPWWVRTVVISRQAADAVGLRLAPSTLLQVAGAALTCRVMDAEGPDVWVELEHAGSAGRSERIVEHRHLSAGLEGAQVAVYARIREDGYSPADARLITAAMWAA